MGVSVRQNRVGKGKPWYVYVHQNKKIVCRKAGGGSKREAEAMAAELRKRMSAGDIALGNGKHPSLLISWNMPIGTSRSTPR